SHRPGADLRRSGPRRTVRRTTARSGRSQRRARAPAGPSRPLRPRRTSVGTACHSPSGPVFGLPGHDERTARGSTEPSQRRGGTGHGVTVAARHRASLARFDFDTVLFPYNATQLRDPAYAADVAGLLDLCAERDVAVQTIKSITLGPWTVRPPDAHTWYEPLTEQDDVDLAVRFVLGHERLFLHTASDLD